MKYYSIIFVIIPLLVVSCESEKKKPLFYELDRNVTDDAGGDTGKSPNAYQKSNSEIIVPFKEKAGVKFVDVSINSCLGTEMIFDTGCSSTLISVAEANYLYLKGYISENDIIGTAQSQIADGRIVENMVIKLKEVVIYGIDEQISCNDVEATVSLNCAAPLLLGNEILDRVDEYTIDNKNKTIKFKLK